MKITLPALSLPVLLAALILSSGAAAQEAIRIGLPTKAYWPTVVAEAALRQKLFEKEGLKAELTVYRSGAEAFSALASGAADIVLDPPALAAAARGKGVMARLVAAGSASYSGWHLVVPANASLTIGDLAGKRVGISAAGSATDLLARWLASEHRLDFARVPVGGGGLLPRLLSGQIDAAIVYPPLSFEIAASGKAKILLDFSAAMPRHVHAGWIVPESLIHDRPAVVQKALNALFGGVHYLRGNRDHAIRLIAEILGVSPSIAAQEYERTILSLETGGAAALPEVELGLAMAGLAGMTGLAPAAEIVNSDFIPVPTRP